MTTCQAKTGDPGRVGLFRSSSTRHFGRETRRHRDRRILRVPKKPHIAVWTERDQIVQADARQESFLEVHERGQLTAEERRAVMLNLAPPAFYAADIGQQGFAFLGRSAREILNYALRNLFVDGLIEAEGREHRASGCALLRNVALALAEATPPGEPLRRSQSKYISSMWLHSHLPRGRYHNCMTFPSEITGRNAS